MKKSILTPYTNKISRLLVDGNTQKEVLTTLKNEDEISCSLENLRRYIKRNNLPKNEDLLFAKYDKKEPVVKEVEKIVYRDNEETLRELEKEKKINNSFAIYTIVSFVIYIVLAIMLFIKW